MKQLILFRHAKSSWKHELLSDFERPLKQKGVLHAKQQAQKLIHEKLVPEVIVSSPAIRAVSTAIIAATEFKIPTANIILEKLIYESSTAQLMKLVKAFSDQHKCVMLVGHNDSISQFASSMCESKIQAMETGGIVVLSFDVDSWKKITVGKLKWLDNSSCESDTIN